MAVIYLSPHLDDVALSLGGLVWEQVQAGVEVVILTICAGDPPPGELSPFAQSAHRRWGVGRDAIAERRAEDMISCQLLGASYHHLDIPDCIYRRSPKTGAHLYDSEEALWVPVHPHEDILINELSNAIQDSSSPEDTLVCPLTLGNHVDHRLTRTAAERLGVPLQYYPDYPYVLAEDVQQVIFSWQACNHPVSPAGIAAWQDAVAAHRSQISTFWKNLDEMRAAIQYYYDHMGGIRLWERDERPADRSQLRL